jgi:isopentenyl diphosphate isomerase/L-lactate dehydrogenase-like FMN-dependent dehydrogenase
MTSLPIVPKGIKTAADAQKCLDLGFPAIYVSNHGGRTLDGAPTAVEILLDIRRNAPEVFEKMEVYADGGVRRATHVITLLALGARAVGLGRS